MSLNWWTVTLASNYSLPPPLFPLPRKRGGENFRKNRDSQQGKLTLRVPVFRSLSLITAQVCKNFTKLVSSYSCKLEHLCYNRVVNVIFLTSSTNIERWIECFFLKQFWLNDEHHLSLTWTRHFCPNIHDFSPKATRKRAGHLDSVALPGMAWLANFTLKHPRAGLINRHTSCQAWKAHHPAGRYISTFITSIRRWKGYPILPISPRHSTRKPDRGAIRRQHVGFQFSNQ